MSITRRNFLKKLFIGSTLLVPIKYTNTLVPEELNIDSIWAEPGAVSKKTNLGSCPIEEVLQIDVQIEYTVAPTLGHLTEVWLVPDGAKNQKEWRFVGGIYNDDSEPLMKQASWYVHNHSRINYELYVTQVEQSARITKNFRIVEFEIE